MQQFAGWRRGYPIFQASFSGKHPQPASTWLPRWMPCEPYQPWEFTLTSCKPISMKDANGFFHISPCMEGRGIERQAKKPKAITANRKINHSTTIFRFAVKIRDGKGKRRALRHLHFPPSFKTNLKLPKASLTTSNGVSRRVLCTIHFIFLSREWQLSVCLLYTSDAADE